MFIKKKRYLYVSTANRKVGTAAGRGRISEVNCFSSLLLKMHILNQLVFCFVRESSSFSFHTRSTLGYRWGRTLTKCHDSPPSSPSSPACPDASCANGSLAARCSLVSVFLCLVLTFGSCFKNCVDIALLRQRLFFTSPGSPASATDPLTWLHYLHLRGQNTSKPCFERWANCLITLISRFLSA